ncbi:hypothetical protein N7582_004189 [Saccharomyces uvarum]|nr:hypothetical protein N7582_004189 [Saccharomyces uvarum]
MGADGGSLSKNYNLRLTIREKASTEDSYELQKLNSDSQWNFCRLSNKPLELPIVSDYKGHLFNKDEIIRWLLDPEKQDYNVQQVEEFQHVQRLNDVVDLRNLRQVDETGVIHCKFGDDAFRANGSMRFVYLAPCGDVFPKNIISKTTESCPRCKNKISDGDIVTINPVSQQDIDNLEERYRAVGQKGLYHNGKKRKTKKTLKRKPEATNEGDSKRTKP